MTTREITFLTVDEVIDLHDDQIALFGGSMGIRDRNLLESAVAMPQAGFDDDYLHEFPTGMAAAYLFHLAQNHPFVDGNKRVALSAWLVFLDSHGIAVDATEDELVALAIDVASGNMDKPAIASFLAAHSPAR